MPKKSPLQTVKPGLDRHGLEGAYTSNVGKEFKTGGGDRKADYGNQNKNPSWPHEVKPTEPREGELGVPGEFGRWTDAPKSDLGEESKETVFE